MSANPAINDASCRTACDQDGKGVSVSDAPILYSFRRCPYAMRARLAIVSSGIAVAHREVLLRDKPKAMLDASPKGTVPVIVLPDGVVIEESLDIMLWALGRNDPEGWLGGGDALPLIAACQQDFKPHLDRYKYAQRYDGADPVTARAAASAYVRLLDGMLAETGFLAGRDAGLADYAILPFVRQFAHVDRDWFYAQDWPRVSRWLTDFVDSARFAQVMVKHPVWREVC